MRRQSSSRMPGMRVAAIATLALLAAGTATVVDAKRPPKPPPSPTPTPTSPSGAPSIVIAIAPTGTLEPSQVYANVEVTVTCSSGWTWSSGGMHLLQNDRGGAGSFSVACTGTSQTTSVRVVNGNRFTLGNWSATAYVNISRNGQQASANTSRTVSLEPGVVASLASEGQLTGTSGGGVSMAVEVACPVGATGQESSVTVSQGGTASGRAFFTPTCDRQAHTHVLAIPASQGTFQTGAAAADASVTVGWNGGAFFGVDNRAITLLESSTGDDTPPSPPAGLSANVMGDGETWLDWAAATDNATPSGLISYEVRLNGQFDQGIGGGYTEAILYVQQGIVNTVDVIAIDGAGNRSTPATVTVDCSQGWCF